MLLVFYISRSGYMPLFSENFQKQGQVLPTGSAPVEEIIKSTEKTLVRFSNSNSSK